MNTNYSPLLPSDNDQWKPFGYAHGAYENYCFTCEKVFMGAKGSTACWNCAQKAMNAEKAKPRGR
jgi:hypothetical protein